MSSLEILGLAHYERLSYSLQYLELSGFHKHRFCRFKVGFVVVFGQILLFMGQKYSNKGLRFSTRTQVSTLKKVSGDLAQFSTQEIVPGFSGS